MNDKTTAARSAPHITPPTPATPSTAAPCTSTHRTPGKTARGMYADIIDLTYEGSPTRPRMSMHDRAAQFLPFAALTGYEDAIRETARQTEARIEPDEEALSRLNRKFRKLMDCCDASPKVRFICFRADERKSGGAYVTVTGQIRRINKTERQVVLQNGTKLPMDDIVDLEIDPIPGVTDTP